MCISTDTAERSRQDLESVAIAIARGKITDTFGDELSDVRDVLEEIGSPRSDSTGRSTIWCWPNVPRSRTPSRRALEPAESGWPE